MEINTHLRRAGAVCAAVFLLLLAAAGILTAARVRLVRSLIDQQAAGRWGGEEAAQLSCFFPDGEHPSFDSFYETARTVDEALTKASLSASSPNARLWYFAASAETPLYASTARASCELQTTVFRGDFFYIHQPALLSGGYLNPDGANAGYIFLDENAAWKLFGATDVAGMSVTLGDAEYIVCGVGRALHDSVRDALYGETPRAWILSDSPAGMMTDGAAVFEAVLPNPLDGFAADLFGKLFFSADAVTVENSSRFTLLSLLRSLARRETLGVRTSSVTFPWWENLARVAEYRAGTYLLLSLLLLAAAALLLLVWIVILFRPFCALLSRVLRGARDRWDAHRDRRLRARQKKTSAPSDE